MKFRNEYDSLGSIKVPQDKYWGASTERSKKHFDIGDFLVRPIVIKSIAMIKKTAAIVLLCCNGEPFNESVQIAVKIQNKMKRLVIFKKTSSHPDVLY